MRILPPLTAAAGKEGTQMLTSGATELDMDPIYTDVRRNSQPAPSHQKE